MTNSLSEDIYAVGQLMADNLNTVGVSDADVDDGLTTLTGKILDVPAGSKKNTSLTIDIDTLVLEYDDSFNIEGYLEDEDNNAIDNASVKLLIGSTVVDTQTTSNGDVTFTYCPVATGTHTFKLVYEGDSTYNGCNSSTVTKDVSKETTLVNVSVPSTSITIYADGSVTVSGTLMDNDSTPKPVKNKYVVVSESGTTITQFQTGNDGTFGGTIQGSTLGIGVHNLKFEFVEDSYYKGSYQERSVTVQSNTLVIGLNAGKQILSYADYSSTGNTEYCRLQATFTGSVLSGKTVQFDIVDSEGTYISTLGTGETNSSGVAVCDTDYVSQGVGDVYVKASVSSMIVSETYGIEDCSRYDKCDTDKISSYTFEEIFNSGITQSLSFDSSDYKVTIPLNASNGSVYHIPLITHSNQKVELSALIKSGTNSGTTNLTADSGFGLVDTVNHKSNMLYLRYINGSNNLGTKRYSRQTNLTSQTHIVNTNLSTNYDNTWLKHTLTVDGLSFTYKITDTSDNTIWEYTNSFDSDLNGKSLSLITGWNNSIHHIKEIKVKPL